VARTLAGVGKTAAELSFLRHHFADNPKPFHGFFYSTAVAQGLSASFDNLIGALREYFATTADASNGNRPYQVEEVVQELQEGEEPALQALVDEVHVV
jgi:hypothetical protein